MIIVGGGAAGIFAALAASRKGAKVLLLEKTPRIGTKILISGGGKCNIAHAGRLEDVVHAFDRREAVFLRPSCYRMPNERIMAFFEDRGLRLFARPNGRVFPADGTARDVLDLLVGELVKSGVQICLQTSVQEVLVSDARLRGVRVQVEATPVRSGDAPTDGGFGAKALLRRALQVGSSDGSQWSGPTVIECGRVIICTGGVSYPNSGTTGDGWKWARNLGHTVVKPRAALAPIYLALPKPELAGVSLQDCGLICRQSGKKVSERRGDLVFTHHGVSGPSVLEISRSVALAQESGEVSLEIDLAPDRSFESLREELNIQDRTLSVGQWAGRLGPRSATDSMLLTIGLDGKTGVAALEKKDRNRLATAVKGGPVGFVKTVPVEKGEVTAGGIELAEVDEKTMCSKLIEGLYLAGEVLDIAGPVGGYNLQAAFATGHVAGESAAADLPKLGA